MPRWTPATARPRRATEGDARRASTREKCTRRTHRFDVAAFRSVSEGAAHAGPGAPAQGNREEARPCGCRAGGADHSHLATWLPKAYVAPVCLRLVGLQPYSGCRRRWSSMQSPSGASVVSKRDLRSRPQAGRPRIPRGSSCRDLSRWSWRGRERVRCFPGRRTAGARKRIRALVAMAKDRGDLDAWGRGPRCSAASMADESWRFAAELDAARGSVHRWWQSVDGLLTGTAPRLSDEQRAKLTAFVEFDALAAGYQSSVWTGPMIGDDIEQRFGVRYHSALLRGVGGHARRARGRETSARRSSCRAKGARNSTGDAPTDSNGHASKTSASCSSTCSPHATNTGWWRRHAVIQEAWAP